MERFDYSSVMAILMDHMTKEAYGSQVTLLELLYAGYVEDTGHAFDNGQVNKWLKGKERFSPKVSTYYMERKHQYDLCAVIEGRLLPMMDDPAVAAQELYELLIQDSGVSEQKKLELTEDFPYDTMGQIAVFLTQVLCFAMVRCAEGRTSVRAALQSLTIRDLIIGGKVPQPCKWFRGREREIEQLHELLRAEDKVFLHGIPGIGKSELAKAYAKRYGREYANVLYLYYQGSLRDTISALEFSDDLSMDTQERRFRKHECCLRTLKTDTLLIIDNFNAMPEEDEYFDTILRWQCRILFTTRNRFEDRTVLELEELDTEALFQMTAALYSDAERHRTVISDIIQILRRHTFAVELAARLLEKGILKPAALRRKLRLERVAMDAADLIRTIKDGKSSRATYRDHIRMLFALFRLSKRKREILRNMTMVPNTGVDATAFAEWLKLPSRNEINDLIELGLIHPEERRISLHPMIREVAMDELPPTIRKCHELVESIHWTCRGLGVDDPYYLQMFQTVERIMGEAGKDDLPGYLRFLEDVFPYMEKYHYERGMRIILEELEGLLREEHLGSVSDRALLLDCYAAMEKDRAKAIELEMEAIRLLGEVNRETAHLAANLHSNLGELYHTAGELDLAAIHMEQGFFLMEEYGLMEYHDIIAQSLNYAMLMGARQEFDRAIQCIMRLAAFLKACAREDTLDHATVQETIALLYMMAGKEKEGLPHYQECLSVWEAIFAEEPERIEEKKAEIRRNVILASQYRLLNESL